MGAQSPPHMPLFILCLVLGTLLLLTVLAFTTALLRVRKRSGKEAPRGTAMVGAALPPGSLGSGAGPAVPC